MPVTYTVVLDSTAGDRQRMWTAVADNAGGTDEHPHNLGWTPEWVFFMPTSLLFYTANPHVIAITATTISITYAGGANTATWRMVVGRNDSR